jgi:WD40 repeat protein
VWQIVNGTWAVVRTFHGPSFPTGLAFTQDVKYIASTNHSNNSVPIFSIQNPDRAIADCVSQLSSDKTRGSWSIAFSNDRKYVAANLDNDVVIIDWQTNPNGNLPHECAQVEKLQGHSAEIRSLVFSPDGNYLLSTSLDGTAILWDAKTWQQLRTLIGHDGEITSAAFSPDSKFIVTGGADKTIRIWDTNYKDTIELVCSILNRFHRDFTDEERARYGITDHDPTCGT